MYIYIYLIYTYIYNIYIHRHIDRGYYIILLFFKSISIFINDPRQALSEMRRVLRPSEQSRVCCLAVRFSWLHQECLTEDKCDWHQYGGFLKWRYFQIIHFNGIFPYKPSIWGTPIDGHPNMVLILRLVLSNRLASLFNLKNKRGGFTHLKNAGLSLVPGEE